MMNNKIIRTGICLFSVFILAFIYIFFSGDSFARQTGKLMVSPGNTILYFNRFGLEVKGWDNDGCTFFFIPSYIDVKDIDQSESVIKICTEGGDEIKEPVMNRVIDVLVKSEADGSLTPWRLGFFQSDDLYTIDISLEGLEYYDIDHYEYTGAVIDVYSPRGRLTYHEADALIKGRGNSSWLPDPEYHKEPYQFKLPDDISLCGMKSTDKWALIYDDPTRIRNKLSYDLSANMGMEYAIESEWADVYINGDYMGCYLLCHEPDIGSGDLNIGSLSAYNRHYMNGAEVIETSDLKGYDYSIGSGRVSDGGYLIEKNAEERYRNKNSGFKSGDDFFTIKSPGYASLDEAGYIRDFVGRVDEKIHNNGTEQLSMIDAYSFARQYLMTELSLDPDGGFTSCYFYKKPGEDILYAGPCWDYDGAYGRWTDPVYKDYNSSTFVIQKHISDTSGGVPLDWDKVLLENTEYSDYVAAVFRECMPEYEKLMTSGIDEYYRKIFVSACMDQIRWEGYIGYEDKIRNSYKQLRFFLYNRLKHMAEVYGCAYSIPEPDIYDDTSHVLTFIYEDGHTEEMTVKDGAQLQQEELPDFDRSRYEGWRSDDQYLSLLSYYDPIFEDRSFVLAHY